MLSYQVCAFRRDGRFAYGAHFRAGDDIQALRRFHALPFGEHRASLFRAERLIGVHPGAGELAAE